MSNKQSLRKKCPVCERFFQSGKGTEFYEDQGWYCDQCNQEFTPHSQIYHCNKDHNDFDLCSNCVTDVKPQFHKQQEMLKQLNLKKNGNNTNGNNTKSEIKFKKEREMLKKSQIKNNGNNTNSEIKFTTEREMLKKLQIQKGTNELKNLSIGSLENLNKITMAISSITNDGYISDYNNNSQLQKKVKKHNSECSDEIHSQKTKYSKKTFKRKEKQRFKNKENIQKTKAKVQKQRKYSKKKKAKVQKQRKYSKTQKMFKSRKDNHSKKKYQSECSDEYTSTDKRIDELIDQVQDLQQQMSCLTQTNYSQPPPKKKRKISINFY